MNNGSLQALGLGNYWQLAVLAIVLFWALQGVQFYDEGAGKRSRLPFGLSVGVGITLVISRFALCILMAATLGVVPAIVQFVLGWSVIYFLPERESIPGSSYEGEMQPGW